MDESEKSSVERCQKEWLQRLSALQMQKEFDGDSWLQLLYSSYLQRFLSDNNRIWTTGQWMIPLSLAPLVAIPNLQRPIIALADSQQLFPHYFVNSYLEHHIVSDLTCSRGWL
ncbi:MAG: hypothetical protein P4L76_13925 [Beijerinckiaceae bacterium]|nr:hypothetical protein [Beijerinckiaceae bacterium]